MALFGTSCPSLRDDPNPVRLVADAEPDARSDANRDGDQNAAQRRGV